jgi:hypothetical protein
MDTPSSEPVDTAEVIPTLAAGEVIDGEVTDDDLTVDGTPVASPEVPIHRVLCMTEGCKAGATYRPTASGTGFMVLERYGMGIDVTLGAGPTGRPECPHGHGEMTFADEQLPVGEAMTEANARLEKQRAPRLPFPAPPFNYEGAFHEIVSKRHDVALLEKKYDEKKAAASAAKKDLDEANEQLGQLIEQFEEREEERTYELERRQRQADEGHPEGTTLVRCLYEQLHPDDLCPLCTGDREQVEAFLGTAITARDASAHVDQVAAYRTKFDVEETEDALASVIHRIPTATITEWTPDERAAVRVWAFAVVDFENGATTIEPPPLPAVLGRPHRAAAVGDDAKVQSCSACGVVLVQIDENTLPFEENARVGLDCAGAEVEATHHYPERKPKAPAKKKTAAKKKAKK